MDPAQPCQRPPPTSSASAIAPTSGSGPGPSPARASPVNRPSAASKSLSPVTSRSPGAAVSAPPKAQSPAQNAAPPPDASQDKLAGQIALVSSLGAFRLGHCDMRLASPLRTQHLTAAHLTERTVHLLCNQQAPRLEPSSVACLGGGRLLWGLFCAEASVRGCCLSPQAIAEGPGGGLCYEVGGQRPESPGR